MSTLMSTGNSQGQSGRCDALCYDAQARFATAVVEAGITESGWRKQSLTPTDRLQRS